MRARTPKALRTILKDSYKSSSSWLVILFGPVMILSLLGLSAWGTGYNDDLRAARALELENHRKDLIHRHARDTYLRDDEERRRGERVGGTPIPYIPDTRRGWETYHKNKNLTLDYEKYANLKQSGTYIDPYAPKPKKPKKAEVVEVPPIEDYEGLVRQSIEADSAGYVPPPDDMEPAPPGYYEKICDVAVYPDDGTAEFCENWIPPGCGMPRCRDTL